MNQDRRREDRRNLAWALAGTVIAGLLTGVTIEVAQAADRVAHVAFPSGEPTWLPDGSDAGLTTSDGLPEADVAIVPDDPATRAELLEGSACAADPPEDTDSWRDGPVITVIDLGEPAYGETVTFNLNLASDGYEHFCEFLFVNSKDEEVQVDHPAWQIHLAEGQERLDWRLQKTFHVTQFPPTADGLNRFALLCDGQVTDQVEFHLHLP